MHRPQNARSWTLLCVGVAIVPLFLGGWLLVRLVGSIPRSNQTKNESPSLAQSPVPSAPVVSVVPIRPAPPKELVDDDEPMENPMETVPVIGEPDPELDKLVEKEAAKEPPAKGKVKLDPIVIKAGPRPPAAFASEIDALIDRKLASAGVPASPQADDAEFLRRVYLDIVGVIPTISKTRSFLTDQSADKRSKLVEELLANTQFGENFAHYWHDLLVKRDEDNNRGIRTHAVFLKWMAHQYNSNRPWDEVVRTMLTASGDQALAGETFFILANSENGQPAPNKLVGTASALFLGNQLMCCECHVHPYTAAWKPQDFWGLAAFFGRTKAERGTKSKNPQDSIARILEDAAKPKGKESLPDGSISIPDPRNEGKFIGVAKPRVLGGEPVDKDSVNRKFVADWFSSPSNPFFARASVNRLWSQFFARGLVNPLDDIRPDSEAIHPEVLQLLAEEFVAAKFDVKHLIRCMIATKAYQRSSRTVAKNANDEDLYSHMAMKVLTPRNLFRSLATATSDQLTMPAEDAAPNKKKDYAATGLGYFDVREYDESPGEYTYGVPHLLRLMNTKLPPACDAMAKAALKLGGRDRVIEHLYLSTLSRLPSTGETKRVNEFLGKQQDVLKGYSLLAWALLSGAEFINNH
ncbi:MAG: DUF1549 domain-containing protein [Gemmataceae bacterium]|nr:DUF1549 domain-containing protein [Gemmataceae bacterium]